LRLTAKKKRCLMNNYTTKKEGKWEDFTAGQSGILTRRWI